MNNISYRKLSKLEICNPLLQSKLVSFLFNELGQYSDPESEIRACLDYILHPDKGGSIYTAETPDNDLCGVVFITQTKMGPFVPDYLLVYIATDKNMRGKGIGKNLINLVRTTLKSPIALHVEHDNPAKKLYEDLGFTSKYSEMRWYPAKD